MIARYSSSVREFSAETTDVTSPETVSPPPRFVNSEIVSFVHGSMSGSRATNANVRALPRSITSLLLYSGPKIVPNMPAQSDV
jgi:hypothetical protein